MFPDLERQASQEDRTVFALSRQGRLLTKIKLAIARVYEMQTKLTTFVGGMLWHIRIHSRTNRGLNLHHFTLGRAKVFGI